MRHLFRLLLLLVLLSLLSLGALLWFGLSDEPTVIAGTRLSHQDIARAKSILDRDDPRDLPAGTQRQLELSEDDLNLAANYLAQKYVPGGARVVLHPDAAQLDASLHLHRSPIRGYLNLSLELLATPQGARLTGLRIGRIAVPDTITRLLLRELAARAGRSRGASLALASVKELQLTEHSLRLTYEWQPELLDAVRDELMPAGQAAAMAVYYDHLVALHATGRARGGSLAEALPPLFQLAVERSSHSDPATENRALLAVLGAWASGRGMDRLLPPEQRKGRPARFRLKLQRRGDFAQHFLTSAALAANGDTLLSDAIGLYKEVKDSQGGSGFSFTDIAADRVGTRFGELASSEDRAAYLQRRLADGLSEADLMPPARDLPEHMTAAEFERRFGGVDSPAYLDMMAEIEARIDRLPLYR